MRSFEDAVPLRKLDDAALVRKFLEGESTLLANQALRVETAFGEMQLLAKREGVIATFKSDDPGMVLVRNQTPYHALIHQALEEKGFVQLNYADDQGLIHYKKHRIPEGYQLHCTESRLLWKEWWSRKKSRDSSFASQMELLVMARGNWYPVRDIAPSNGLLHIKTLVTEIVIESFSQIAWLKRSEDSAPAVENPENSDSSSQEGEGSQSFYSRRYGVRPRKTTPSPSQTSTPDLPADLTPRRRPAQPADAFGGEDLASNPSSTAQQQSSRSRVDDRAGSASTRADATDQRSRSEVSSDPWGWDTRFKTDREKSARETPEPHAAPPSQTVHAQSERSQQNSQSQAKRHPGAAEQAYSPTAKSEIGRSVSAKSSVPSEDTLIEPVAASPTASSTAVEHGSEKSKPTASKPETKLADLSTVLRFSEGKVYVTTLLGELVVEGKDLKFWLNQPLETT